MSNCQSVVALVTSCLRNNSEDEDLVKRFWQEWQQYRDYLYRCCLKWMGGNSTDAEDALSRAMIKAWEKVQKYAEEIANFKAWLTRLTHNLCVDIHRERDRSANRVEDIEVYASNEEQGLVWSEKTPESAIETGEKRIVIRCAINNLPARLRETFILHFYQELSYPEIAQQQEISYQNVCKRISQARAILREELRGYFIGEDETDRDLSVTPALAATEPAIGKMSEGKLGVEPIVGETVTLSVAVEEVESVVGEESIEVVRSVQRSESALVAPFNKKLEVKRDGCCCVETALCELPLAPILALAQFDEEIGRKNASNSKNSEINFGERLSNVSSRTLQNMIPIPGKVPEAPNDIVNGNITDVPDIYPTPGWVWQYPLAKQSILKFAQPSALTIVELFHYALFLTQLGVAYALYHFPPHASYESLFWLMMAPVFQILAGFAPIVMHEYEGWQVAPFEDQPLNRGKYNNERLREAAYKLLFAYQAVAAIMFIIGVYGVQQWKFGFLTISNPWTLIIIGSTFVWLYISPRTPLSTFNVNFGQGKRPVFPIPIGILVTFAIATLIYIFAMIHLYGLVPALITTVFLLLGGATEGLIAESTFNQFWHWLAVVFLGAAGITQIIALVYA